MHLGLPDTCAQGSRILTTTIKGENLGLHRKERETKRSPNWGFFFKPLVWLYSRIFYLSEFGQQNPQQVLTGTAPGEAEGAGGSIAKMYF